jgi:AbrB family looped-hinge helix DNA binding protein
MDDYRITTSGQVSIPAAVRKRWRTRRVLVEDKGDHVVIRPMPDDPLEAAFGVFKDLDVRTDELRRIAREDERRAEARRVRPSGAA